MSQRFMDTGRTVGYDWGEKKLIVTLSEKMAQKMRADGWNVGHEPEIGYFVIITLTEGEDVSDPDSQVQHRAGDDHPHRPGDR